METRPTIFFAFADHSGRRASCFSGTKGTGSSYSLFIAFLGILSMTLSVYGGENEQATQAVRTLREKYEHSFYWATESYAVNTCQ
jgi:hypothetical protein